MKKILYITSEQIIEAISDSLIGEPRKNEIIEFDIEQDRLIGAEVTYEN